MKAALLGERVASAVREVRLPDRGASLALNLSVGVAEIARDSATTCLQQADAALYVAKHGGGRVNVAT